VRLGSNGGGSKRRPALSEGPAALARRIVAENQRYYNGMLVGVHDLLISRQNEINAARDSIAAVRDYWVARSELERALGGRAPGGSAETAGEGSEPGRKLRVRTMKRQSSEGVER